MSQDKPRVLIAEDNPGLARALEFSLKHVGFDVTVRHNGAEAWETVREDKFDAVITDHEMPGMTGVELCRQMRATELHATTPLVMVTGRQMELEATKLKEELNLAAIFPKPYSPRNLVTLVKEVIADSTCESTT